jgi:outer membrane protein assembly factor BamB
MTISRIFAVVAVSAGALAAADAWPGFRGAQSNAVAEGELPIHWSATENVTWKTEIPGIGWSSPVVWGDRIFLTSVIPSGSEEAPKKGLYFGGERKAPADEHRWMVYCVDFKTGKIAWQHEVFRGVPKQSHHLKNTYASETPVTDGEMVYFLFGNTGLYAFDMSGNAKWSRTYEPQNTRYGWGTGASPILYNGRLYVVNDNDEHSYIDVLDKKTGAVIAKIDRTGEGTNWATPFIWENEKRTELIVNGTKHVRSYDLDGKLLWEFSGMSSIAIPTPFAKFGLLYLSSGYVGDQVRPVYAIRPGASGDISLKTGEASSAFVAWYLPQGGAYNPTPVIYGDYYYTLLDRGFLTCHDARTGKEVYAKVRIDPAVGEFTASPIAANGKLYLFSEGGDAFVVEAGPEYKLIAKNSLDEMVMATPAAVRGSVIIRTASHLYRIGK